MASPTVIFYVPVHELAHFREAKHGKKFGEIVERALLDYRRKSSGWMRMGLGWIYEYRELGGM